MPLHLNFVCFREVFLPLRLIHRCYLQAARYEFAFITEVIIYLDRLSNLSPFIADDESGVLGSEILHSPEKDTTKTFYPR